MVGMRFPGFKEEAVSTAFRSVIAASAGVAALVAVSCKQGGAAPAEAASAPTTAQVAPLGSAVIMGEVKFVGKVPKNPVIDMSEEAKCQADYKTAPRDPVVVVNPNGTLADVFVYVKSGLPANASYPPPTSAVAIDQQGCLYHPRVFGIMVGQPLEIKNSDPLLHNIKAMGKDNRPFNISQPAAGMTTDRSFSAEEVMLPFECNVHGWMHAYAGVLPYPFFATTGPDGKFTISNLPAGTYVIEAWQDKYGAQTDTVTVGGSETKTLTFTFKAQGA